MMKKSTHNQISLPFFPMGILLLPGEKAPLRIFEPRYKQLIAECQEQSVTFGVPYIRHRQITDMGSEVKLNKVLRIFENGEMIVVIEGISLFRILDYQKEIPGKLYGGGEVEILSPDRVVRDPGILTLAEELGLLQDTRAEEKQKIGLLELAGKLNMNASDKLHLIMLEEPARKEKFITGLLLLEKTIRKQKKTIGENVQLN
ncbi:MAG TPA: hypothetical protein ENF21_02085 [Bacteroidetes bacterium]|nr:hypothetical protein [Bacteroidota bacterium]